MSKRTTTISRDDANDAFHPGADVKIMEQEAWPQS